MEAENRPRQALVKHRVLRAQPGFWSPPPLKMLGRAKTSRRESVKSRPNFQSFNTSNFLLQLIVALAQLVGVFTIFSRFFKLDHK